jgi:hypothetical protein
VEGRRRHCLGEQLFCRRAQRGFDADLGARRTSSINGDDEVLL